MGRFRACINTLNPKAENLNPKAEALSPKPQSRNPKPQVLNPQPQPLSRQFSQSSGSGNAFVRRASAEVNLGFDLKVYILHNLRVTPISPLNDPCIIPSSPLGCYFLGFGLKSPGSYALLYASGGRKGGPNLRRGVSNALSSDHQENGLDL